MAQTISHARPVKAKKRFSFLAFILILAALAVFAAFGLFLYAVATGMFSTAKSKTVENPEIVLLENDWARGVTACADEKALSAYLGQTLDTVSSIAAEGRAAVALTGRTAAGEALFVDSTETLSRPAVLAGMDGFLSKADALKMLISAASKRGIAVYLIPTDDGGMVTSQDAGAAAVPAWEQKLCDTYALPLLMPGTAEDLFSASEKSGMLSAYVSDGRYFVRADANPALLAGTVQNDTADSIAGVVLGSYSTLTLDTAAVSRYHTYVSGDALPDLAATCQGGRAYTQSLAVAYPVSDGATVTTDSVFLMGTSDPAQPLTMNGAEVVRYGTKGVWGVLAPLEMGTNAYDFVNGGATVHYTVNRQKAASGGNYTVTPDGTPGEEATGKKVRITDAIASALEHPRDSSTMRETLYTGATATITEVYTYTSGTKRTHAYKLSTGDYIRAAACEVIDAPDAAFSSIGYTGDAGENCASLTFAGGTPAVYHSWENNTLTLTFLNASADAAAADLGGGAWFGASGETANGNYVLTLTFPENDALYGWAVNYDTDANTTTIWLKHTPHLSADPALPLSGITIMLDAGHGGDENGAMGAAGMSAQLEKDLNLSAATAAKTRLEQLGATVIMTRSDDSTLSLGARVTAMNTQHPDLFISVHHNSIELNNDVNNSTGTEAYWFFDEGVTLADNLIAAVCDATGRPNRGSDYGYYYVTRSNICPATLLELGFVTNPAEYEACADTETLWAEGGAIAEGVYETIAANG